MTWRDETSVGRGRAVLVGFAVIGSCLVAPPLPAQEVRPSYVPHRVYDAGVGAFTDFEMLAARAARADGVIFGEQHGDPGTHRLQLALLEGLDRRTRMAVVALEMFDRDVQPLLDAYLAGAVGEEEFLADARPWPRYAPDYRPLVELARARGWRAVAANAPRPIATAIAREGLAALRGLPRDTARYIPADIRCPEDAYFEAFVEQMREHPAPDGETAELPRETIDRFYLAQCVRDETMAEALMEALDAGPGGPVVLFTGAFHMAYGRGVVERVVRRRPDARVLTILAAPVENLDEIDAAAFADRADVVVFTLRPDPHSP